jgi:CBS domain containing-hemolysin-like protein
MQSIFKAYTAEQFIVAITQHIPEKSFQMVHYYKWYLNKIESEEFHTIGGFLSGLFGHLPKVGEQLRYHDLRFLILEVEGKKNEKIKITKI